MKTREMTTKTVFFLFLTRYIYFAHGESPLRPAEPEEFPFQVSVNDLQKDHHLCSGVLITNRTVIAPASCVPPDILVKVSAGSIYRKKQNRTTNYVEVIRHFKYNRSETTNDIAIIKVANPFRVDDYVAPAKIPTKGTKLVNVTSFTGWNLLHASDALSVCENYTLHKDCKSRYGLDRDLGPDEFCGDHILGPDYGSVISKNGVVYGLETYSSPLKQMHSFVEISAHADWIKENLGNESTEVKWHKSERNEAGSKSNCMAAMLLFAVFLCQ